MNTLSKYIKKNLFILVTFYTRKYQYVKHKSSKSR